MATTSSPSSAGAFGMPFGNGAVSQPNFNNFGAPPLPPQVQSIDGIALLNAVTASPQWAQTLKTQATTLKAKMLTQVQVQVKALQAQVPVLSQDLVKRLATLQTHMTAIQETVRLNASAPALAASPTSFQAGIRITDQQSRLGLQGFTVRLYSTQSPGTALATATTDTNGNAVLSLPAAGIGQGSSAGALLAIEVLSAQGKVLYTGTPSVSPATNQVAGVDISLPSSADTQAALKMATAIQAGQQAQLAALTAKAGQLQTLYQQRQTDITTQINRLQTVVTSLQPTAG